MQKLLLLLLCLVAFQYGFSQSDWTRLQDQNLVELRQSLNTTPHPLPGSSKILRISPIWKTSVRSKMPTNLAAAPVPPAWIYQELAFFCKLEVKMEKALNLPVKFRLGEVQAVEKMEGKLKTYFVE